MHVCVRTVEGRSRDARGERWDSGPPEVNVVKNVRCNNYQNGNDGSDGSVGAFGGVSGGRGGFGTSQPALAE